MSQISKCPKLRVVLGYWEALGEVSELRYKNLLYSSSKRSYCSSVKIKVKPRENLLEMNVALVNLWEISEPWPGGIQGGQPEGLS